MSKSTDKFHWADYVVFAVMLSISCAIGLYHAFTGGKQKTQKEFLLADRNMYTIPTAISMTVSLLSSVLILGYPAEMYIYGTQFWLYGIGASLSCVFAGLLFVPLLYPLNLTSSYEYLELRFQSKITKITASIMLIISQILYIAIVLYSPSTALEGVTGIPAWILMICAGLVATFYTTLGGIKAVVWVDALQAVIMLGGMVTLFIIAVVEIGGGAKMWEINRQGQRVKFFDFDPDPTKRSSFWSLVVGGCVQWVARMGVQQTSVQRYSSLPSLNRARLALLISIPGIFTLITITCLVGMTMYAWFADCDPLSHPDPDKKLGNSNQLLPYFVLQVLGWPGIPGLFVAALFSASLSTVSSSLNALSAVVWEDMLKWKLNHLSETKKTAISKILVVIFGAIGIGMTFAVAEMGGIIVRATISFVLGAEGPVLGMFILGSIFPFANWLGATVGGIAGLVFSMWISVGSYVVNPYVAKPPMSIEGCIINATMSTLSSNFTIDFTEASSLITTTMIATTTSDPNAHIHGIKKLYELSYNWIPVSGTVVTVVLGLIISLITYPFLPGPRASEIDRRYLIPIFDRLCCFLPNKCREPCRFGQEQDDSTDKKYMPSDNYSNTGDQYNENGINTAFDSKNDISTQL